MTCLAEQGVASRALPHSQKGIQAPTAVSGPLCAQRAAGEGVHSQSSGACSLMSHQR